MEKFSSNISLCSFYKSCSADFSHSVTFLQSVNQIFDQEKLANKIPSVPSQRLCSSVNSTLSSPVTINSQIDHNSQPNNYSSNPISHSDNRIYILNNKTKNSLSQINETQMHRSQQHAAHYNGVVSNSPPNVSNEIVTFKPNSAQFCRPRPHLCSPKSSFSSMPLLLFAKFVFLFWFSSLIALSHQQLQTELNSEIENIRDFSSDDLQFDSSDGSTAGLSIIDMTQNDSSDNSPGANNSEFNLSLLNLEQRNNCEDMDTEYNFTALNFPGIATIKKVIGWEGYLKIVLYVCTMLAALVGNAAVVFAVSNKRSTVNMYLANLAVADILICVCCMWVHLVNNLTSPKYVLGPLWCKINGYAQMTCLTSSVLTLSAISCDRYMAIMFPFRSRVTKKRTDAVIISIWLFSLLISVPFFIYRRFTIFKWKDYTEINCFETWPTIRIYVPEKNDCIQKDYYKQGYYMLVSSTLFFVPVFTMITAYSAIIWKLWVNKLPGEANYANIRVQKKSKQKVIKMVVVILLVFIICWLPLQVTLLYSIYVHSAGELPRWFLNISYYATFIAYSNSAFNPLIYGGFNKNFREALCNQSSFCAILWCKQGRSLSRQQYSTKSLSTMYTWVNRESQMSRTSHYTHNTLINHGNSTCNGNGKLVNGGLQTNVNGTRMSASMPIRSISVGSSIPSSPKTTIDSNKSNAVYDSNSNILVDLKTEIIELELRSKISHL